MPLPIHKLPVIPDTVSSAMITYPWPSSMVPDLSSVIPDISFFFDNNDNPASTMISCCSFTVIRCSVAMILGIIGIPATNPFLGVE